MTTNGSPERRVHVDPPAEEHDPPSGEHLRRESEDADAEDPSLGGTSDGDTSA